MPTGRKKLCCFAVHHLANSVLGMTVVLWPVTASATLEAVRESAVARKGITGP